MNSLSPIQQDAASVETFAVHNSASPLEQKLYEETACFLDTLDGCHGLDHTRRVHNIAKHLGETLKADLPILNAAAILHDIGRPEEQQSRGAVCHAARGAELARPILQRLHFTEEAIAAILHCIASHRFRSSNPPLSLEAKILFDADKLDSIGATGIGRAFLFAGQVGAKLHNAGGRVEETEAYSLDDTAYREFRLKLCKVKNKMQTAIGLQLAKERHAFMELFFGQLIREIDGEWNCTP